MRGGFKKRQCSATLPGVFVGVTMGEILLFLSELNTLTHVQRCKYADRENPEIAKGKL